GNAAFFVRWRGTLQAPAEGSYTFQTSSNGPSLLQIDGKTVVDNQANNGLGMVPGTVQLTAGPHTVDLRYAWQGGPGRMEWYWTPPGGQSALVPPTVLTPEARSWPRGAVPDPTDAPGNVAAPPPPPVTTAPDAVLTADAGLKEPRGIGVLKDGQLFVADSGNFRVVHLDASGKLVGSWGSETKESAPGKFGTIADLAITPEGNIATLDVTTGDVQVFAPDSKVLLQIPAAAPNSSGIAVGPDGRIWVANTSSSRILRFTPDGKPDGELTGGADGTRGKFEQPIDVAVAPDGTAYVVDLRGRILRLDAQGNTAAEWPVEWGGARGGSHLAVAGDKVIMTDPDRHRLDVLDPATGEIHVIGGPGKDPGQFRLPVGIASGAGGKVYVVDSDNSRVQVFHDLK
ncbi:MAG TPA: PA14 domain-containing protein, partial [Chloroflexia bacterium]|nr:PA14 domain-containing protein [Chloroflexia bacterium]